uniref:Acetolactate synthase n=1 Tax=Candidatus Methanophagaceae archaeon ANME-1 ERB6 TaxID=2759912 RepID=A0A7G9YTD5_9EURY|nr:3D-(3,5/4)-trihydroxycyclohexane-1,2-dione hydrolase [Methanosarcinales archaeon ANME-1 ERB6]
MNDEENGGEAIIKTLIKHKITHTFGFPGAAIVAVYDALLEHPEEIRNILVRHEQGAAHAADGFARATGNPGVCIVTSGPGASNLVTGMSTAFMDSSPVIAMAGQVAFRLIGHEAFQETDMVDIALHTCKKDFQIRDANEIFPVFNEAFRLATDGRPGPVYIDLTKDAQEGESTKRFSKKVPMSEPKFIGQREELKKVASLLLQAERPVMLIGGGVLWANASREVMSLADRLKIHVANTLMGSSAFPDNHPLSLGMAGMYGTEIANYAIENADLLLAVGCRFSNRTAKDPEEFAKGATVIHIDVDPTEINRNKKADLAIVGDARLVLSELLKIIELKLSKNTEFNWIKQLKELREGYSEKLDYDTHPIDYRRVFYELRKFVEDEDIIVTGVGCHQMMAQRFIPRKYPRTFITSGGEGTMGFGLPAAIGAKVAKPESEIINIDGDGSFQMTLEELAVLAQENLKVITVICNNHYLGMVRQWQKNVYGRYSSVYLGEIPDFSKIADAYGLNGIEVSRTSEIAGALEKARKSNISSVIDIHVKPEQDFGETHQLAVELQDSKRF